MGDKPILMLDTSAINHLADDSHRDALISSLISGFFLRLTFTSIDEVAATSDNEKRDRLLYVWRRLLQTGECLLPGKELLQKLVESFRHNSCAFVWSLVDVRLDQDVEARLRDGSIGDIGDDNSSTVRQENKDSNERFEKILEQARPAFTKVFEANPNARPQGVADLISGFQRGGQYWQLARNLYNSFPGCTADEETVRTFEEACPPFRCLMVALCVALYDRNVRLPNVSGSLRAGWADTFMAACLPYCSQFVTEDGRQLACYLEVAKICAFDLNIRSWSAVRANLSGS